MDGFASDPHAFLVPNKEAPNRGIKRGMARTIRPFVDVRSMCSVEGERAVIIDLPDVLPLAAEEAQLLLAALGDEFAKLFEPERRSH